jgi:MbtH protein
VNPFDNEDDAFFVLKNASGQFSLWPNIIEIPNGWEKEFGPAIKAECVKFIDANWFDVRPGPLRS